MTIVHYVTILRNESIYGVVSMGRIILLFCFWLFSLIWYVILSLGVTELLLLVLRELLVLNSLAAAIF